MFNIFDMLKRCSSLISVVKSVSLDAKKVYILVSSNWKPKSVFLKGLTVAKGDINPTSCLSDRHTLQPDVLLP